MIKFILIYIFLIFANNSYSSNVLNITFLGTGSPRPDINKLGPSVLIKNKNEEIILDIGRGTTLRLNQIGNDFSKIKDIYISHFHFDHIVGLPDFWLTSNLWQKKEDTNVYGPKGIKSFCNSIRNAFKEDIKYRYNKNIKSNINCFNFSKINNDSLKKIKVLPFENSHGHIDNSYGFKIIFKDKKIVYSGDTTYSDNLINNYIGSDILIHEIIATTSKIYQNNKKLRKVFSTHTSINQIIKILNKAKPKLTILNHALLFGVSEDFVLSEIGKKYKGKVIFSKDLMSIDLGEELNIFNIGNIKK